MLEDQLEDGLDNITLYPWQRRFISATATNRQCLLMCANRVGKTYTGCFIDAVHLTGRYPDWWDGYRFDHPPLVWCLGYSGDKCRDLLQSALFGSYSSGVFTGGLISPNLIVDCIGGAIPRLAQQVTVEWVGPDGELGESVVQFKSYSQGQAALMGDDVDLAHIDEEPKDPTIWPQVLTRTMSADKGRGGRCILTFTPENGKTELVTKFMDDPGPGQYLQTATWDDAPHLSEEVKEEILAAFPAYQRDMRSKGIPLMGSGLIFQIDEDDIKCEPFEVPSHWFVINGMDFGWDHPQAHVQLVWDRDADMYYFINAFKKSKIQPFEAWHVVKPWAQNVPTAWPSDGLQTEKGSAKQQKDYYEEAGFRMLHEHAQWEDGGVGVWAGIMELNNLMKSGRLKIVRTLFELFEEIRQYHTKTTADGRFEIVKIKDDLISACFAGDTEVITESGPMKIIDLVGTSGKVVSVSGQLERYSNCRMTRRSAEVIRVVFEDGHSVVCTPDHKFLTVNGWCEALHLHDLNVIQAHESWQSFSTALSIQNLDGTTGQGESSCTGKYGRFITAKYLAATISTTLTGIQKTIASKILNVSTGKNIFQCIKKGITDTRMQHLRLLLSGDAQKKAKNTLAKLARKTRTLCTLLFRVYASNAGRAMKRLMAQIGSVVTNAGQSGVGILESMTKLEFANCAPQVLSQTNTKKQDTVVAVANERAGALQKQEEHTLKVLRVESAGISDVYCMEVENTHAFALANGAIAHNCRYAYMMRRYAIRVCDLFPEQYAYQYKRDTNRDTVTGY